MVILELSDYLDKLPDLLGIVGVVIILLYYFLLQIGKCPANSLNFSLANFIGSALLLFSLWFNWNLASVVIEISWLFISLYGLIRSVRVSRSRIND